MIVNAVATIGVLRSHRMTAAILRVIIDDSDTVFVRYKKIKNKMIGSRNATKTSPVIKITIPNRNPIAVETALPPLKFA